MKSVSVVKITNAMENIPLILPTTTYNDLNDTMYGIGLLSLNKSSREAHYHVKDDKLLSSQKTQLLRQESAETELR